jgi:heterogeneous nuclear ribonucleoprotein A1/A3
MGKSEYGGGGGSGSGSGSGSAGKIFVGGLARDTTLATFQKHFGTYGEIVDSVIMKNKHTSQPRGFGFITYSDPAVVDKVMEDNHVINGKQVEIKRTIPKDSMQSNPKDFKTKKIFVGGLPPTLTEDDFKEFFENFGAVVEHQIMHDHQTRRSRGFGFVVFDSEQVVDELLAKGSMIDLAGAKVSPVHFITEVSLIVGPYSVYLRHKTCKENLYRINVCQKKYLSFVHVNNFASVMDHNTLWIVGSKDQ